MRIRNLIASAVTIILPGHALAQEEFSVDWHTIDCGGGSSNGDEFVILATIAQPDAGNMGDPDRGADSFSIAGGFWAVVDTGGCYPNCDSSTSSPILNANDFHCFLNAFASGDSFANCDGSTSPPVLSANDFQCFLNAFAAGCT